MPTTTQGTLRPLRRAYKRAARRAGGFTRRPFGRLVQHFLARLVREGHADSGELQLGFGALMGLLATPGAFQCLLMFDKYSSFLNWLRGNLRRDLLITSASDKYMFVSISMALAGIVTVIKWDRIMPDAQDYLNLAPLPVRRRNILLANATALSIAVAVLTLAVNGASVVLFPLFVASAAPTHSINPAGFMAAQAICVILASLFAFFAVFAVLGTLAAALPAEMFRACSSWLRGVLMVAFLALLLAGFAGPAVIHRLEVAPDSAVRWLPPLWYLSLYQRLQHRASPAMAKLAPMAGFGLVAAFGLMIFSYGLSYRRRFAAILEGGARPSGRRILRLASACLDLFAYRESGFRRAGYRFVIQTLLRNEAQRFWIAVSLALGWLLAFQFGSSALFRSPPLKEPVPEVALLAAPLMTAYLLVLGLRLAFELPAVIPANWIFRSILNSSEHESLGIARRVMLAFLAPLVLLPYFAFFFWFRNLATAAFQSVYVACLSVCLIELFLSGYRKIPFTCAVPGFRENLPAWCFLLFLGFVAFATLGAELEHWMLVEPVRLLLFPAAMATAYFWNQMRLKDAREAGELEVGLSFDSRLSPTVQQLKLFDSE